MKNINTDARLIASHRGLTGCVILGEAPVPGREERPRTRSRLARWAAVLALAIALAPAAASAQEDDTLTISSTFRPDWLYGTVGADLAEVYANGHDHTWTLTLYGTSQTHGWASWGGTLITTIHATSFDFEFFGPDAATLNGVVTEHIAGGEVAIELYNAYSWGQAYLWVEVSGPEGYFWTGNDLGDFGSFPLFPADADGYPVVGPEPFSIESEFSWLGDNRDGNNGTLEGGYNLVTLQASMGPEEPPAPPTLSIADASVVEGNRGRSKLQFYVSRSGSGDGTVTVSYRTVDGTARANSDYSAATGTLTFRPGDSSQAITIAVKGDRTREPDETLTEELFNASGGIIADAVATGTILNDD